MPRAFAHYCQIHTFQVKGTNKACGESNVVLNGQKLDSEWDGATAHGRDYLDIYGGKEAEWHISCLYNVVPKDGSSSNGEDVVHVLSLRVLDGRAHRGFTVSYKQMGRPSILRFKPRYNPTDMAIVPSLASLWRTPSVEFDPDVLVNTQAHDTTAIVQSLHRGQAILKAKIEAFKNKLKSGIKKVEKMFCHKAKEMKSMSPETPALNETRALLETSSKVPSDRPLDPPLPSHDELTSTTEDWDTTNTSPIHPAAATRSLSHIEAVDPTAATVQNTSFPSQSEHNLQLIKLFGLILILSSCLAWIFLRCRDPRQRADCLARREERRTKKLYRRAAREHKVKMFLRNSRQCIRDFCLRYRLAPKDAIAWDEKQARVLKQEDLLEDFMRDDIRALRNAHRVVSDITAAEEGRATLVYEVAGSDRRRSVATLPGYESEGSQPPSYEDVDVSPSASIVANGFRYTAAEIEFRSDSSVISTSPRISRDGTNSDFDEKIEPISLEASGPAGTGR